MSGKRTWSRVEAPGTLRGHALEAKITGDHFLGWENADGSWFLATNGSDPVRCRDWTEVRQIAEGGGARASNPLDPLTATAAAGGMAFAMRSFLMDNPSDKRRYLSEEHAVLYVVPVQWLTKPPRRDRYGNVWLMARAGHRGRILRAVRRARLPFPVQVMELE
jgi:hypothetical protein